MPLKLLPHEPGVEDAAAAGLRDVLVSPSQAAPLFGEEIDSAVLAAPHRGFALDPDRLSEPEVLGAARPYALRYLILASPDAVGSVDVAEDDDGVSFSVARIGSGPYDAAMLAALHAARARLAPAEPEIEPRFLISPDLHLAALWLHGDGEEIVPLAPEPEGLAAGRAYSEQAIAPILRRLAEPND
jgi:hypothetical protein